LNIDIDIVPNGMFQFNRSNNRGETLRKIAL